MIPISFWCLYCTKLEPISKTNDSEKAPRTGEYASNPERKNTPCISDLAGVKFFLKKERVFFFRGSAFQVFRQCVGLKCGLGKTKICFSGGKDFSFCLDWFPPRRRGLGRDAGGVRIRQIFFAPIRIHIWDYTSILRISAIVDKLLISIWLKFLKH